MALIIVWVFSLIEGIFLFIARRDILFSLKAKFLKRKGYGKIIEMRNNKTIRTHLKKIGKEEAEIDGRTYGTSPSDVCYDLDHGIPAVIVNESTVRSVSFIDEKNKSAIDSLTLTKLIQRAKSIGAMGYEDNKKLFYAIILGLGVCVIAVLIVGYLVYRNSTLMETALESIKSIGKSTTAMITAT